MSSCLVETRWRRPTSGYPGTTILIADSDRCLAYSLGRGLEQQGFFTLMARTAADAIDLARMESPQLVVLDHRTPDLDGVVLLDRLNSDPDTCHIPAIILSNMARPDILRRSRVSACQYFVRKPCDLKALFYLIQHALTETIQLATS